MQRPHHPQRHAKIAYFISQWLGEWATLPVERWLIPIDCLAMNFLCSLSGKEWCCFPSECV
jgi:hypothetical protein